MKQQVIDFLRSALPYIAVIVLWRLAAPFWNPAGILALIPIFFYTFARPTRGFTIFAALFCFLIDYQAGTLFFWTALYCMLYAANGFQTIIDLTRLDNNALLIFMLFFGAGLFVLFILHPGWTTLWRGIWTFAWASVLYMPITTLLIRGGRHD